MSLRAKFSIAVVSLLLVVVAGIAALVVASERRLLRAEMAEQQQRLVERLAQVCQESLYQSDLVALNYLRTLAGERAFLAAACVDSAGQARLHSDPARIGQALTASGTNVLELSAPVLFGGQAAGTARLFLSRPALDDFLDQATAGILRRVGIISLIALVAGVLGALWLAGTLVRPIHQVIGGMREVARGRLQPIPFSVRKDELGWIGKELNVMIDRLKELDEMKRDFVSGVTHELRSPLTAIDRYVTLLGKGTYGALSARQADAVITVQNNTKRLMRFIDDLLSAARLETRRVDLFCERLDLRAVIQEVEKLYRPLAEEKKLSFKAEAPAGLIVWADREKVIQILSNLLSNAIKFTAAGSVALGARPDGKMIRVSVADTGAGIPEKDRDQIFEKFYRSPSTAAETAGTGLGLAITKSLVEAQGGRIEAKSNPGGGTRFEFTLPVADSLQET